MDTILVAFVTAVSSIICQLMIWQRSNSLLKYRIEQLEEIIKGRDDYAERLVRIESRLDEMENLLKPPCKD